MQLEKIIVEGFKSIKSLELEIKPLNVLIGANGAGKTNLISLFQLLNQMMLGEFQVRTAQAGADSLLYFGSKVTDQIHVELSFVSFPWRYQYGVFWKPTHRDTLIFASERCTIQNIESSTEPIVIQQLMLQGRQETELLNPAYTGETRTVVDQLIDAVQSCKVYHFHDTSPEAGVKKTGDIDDNERLRPDAANLAAFLYKLRETSYPHYQRIIKTIRLVAPFFNDFNLRPLANPDKIRLEWREYGTDTYFNAHSLSDGTLRFMCLATLLLQPDLPSIVLIDEPELGLHPFAITLLANLLRSAATQTQVIVSTQSVPLINQFTPEDIIVVDRDEEQSTFNRLDAASLEDWLSEYGLGDLWEKNIIGGRPQRVRVAE